MPGSATAGAATTGRSIFWVSRFAGTASEAGLDGLIVPDLPPEESDELLAALEPEGIDPVFLVAPTSTDVAFMSDDWNDPGAAAWMTTPFYTFTGDKLTFSCTYNNPGSVAIDAGERADKDEMCMATGYLFPATEPELCVCAGATCVYP